MQQKWKRAQILARFGVAAIYWCALFVLGCFGFWILAKAITPLWMTLTVLVVGYVMGFVDAVALWLWQRLRHKPPRDFARTWGVCLVGNSLQCGAAFSILYLAALIINSNFPFVVPRVTLTNGDKQVIFQGMFHVGSGSFYERVVVDMLQAQRQDYVFFYEGYSLGTTENNERFNEALGHKGDVDAETLQTGLADACGLKHQWDYFVVWREPVKTDPAHHVVVDVSVDEMMTEWDRLVKADSSLQQEQDEYYAKEGSANDLTWSRIFQWIASLNEDQKELIALTCTSALNIAAGWDFGASPPFSEKVIVDYRNRVLTEKILAHPHSRIYVTYGAAHFEGVYQMLRAYDAQWHITDVQWRQPISSQVEHVGNLRLDKTPEK